MAKPDATRDHDRQNRVTALEWFGLGRTPDLSKARWLGPLLTVALALFLLFLFATSVRLVASVWNNPSESTAGAGPSLGISGIIVAFLSAPFVIWRSLVAQRTVNIAGQSHITDQINKAVLGLGTEKTVKIPGKDENGKDITVEKSGPNLEVRIGAIYALERIARLNLGEHVQIMEILTAYIRENAKVDSLEIEDDIDGPFVPRSDIQVALDVIKRRNCEQIDIEKHQKYRLDLRRVDFRGVNLQHGSFRGAIFYQSRFEHADLSDSDFAGARFNGSILNKAYWLRANLVGAHMDHCKINQPIAARGGLNFGLNSADVSGLCVASADLSALIFIGSKSSRTFGTKDTILSWEMDRQRDEAIELKCQIGSAVDNGNIEELDKLTRQIGVNRFECWSPYDGDDFITHTLLQKFRTSISLTGWPYDN